MSNSIGLVSNYITGKKISPKNIRKIDFPYKAKQIFGLGGKNEKKRNG